jgi:hypothetical protein
MYAEINADAIPVLKPRLQEMKIVYITTMKIENAKPTFKPVRNPYMIKLNKRTEISDPLDNLPTFPKYTFFLTPLSQIFKFDQYNEYFLGITYLPFGFYTFTYIYHI